MMSEETADNVIHVQFGQTRQTKKTDDPPRNPLYDPATFAPDPLGIKKRDVFAKYIEEGMVSVTLDPRAQGARVPKAFGDREELVLNFSHRFFIEDFAFDADAICASLSFSGKPFYCIVPWASVKMLLSHHNNAVTVFDMKMLY